MIRWLFRPLLRWYYFRRYGVCPTHMTLCREGGGYEPKWICQQCDDQNRLKHTIRGLRYINAREVALKKVRRMEGQ